MAQRPDPMNVNKDEWDKYLQTTDGMADQKEWEFRQKAGL